MQTTSVSNLFQSDAQHLKQSYREAKFELHKTTADPIQLGSKPLRIVVRQQQGKEADAWVAESGFVVRKVGLESGKTKQIYRGHKGPVTCLDFYAIPASATSTSPPPSSSPPRQLLISGSWDKSIRVWDTATKTLLSTTLAHADFVKALLVIPSLQILLTGSSDKDLKVWDLSELSSRDFSSLLSASSSSSSSSSTTPPNQDDNDATDLPPPTQTGAAPIPATSLHPLSALLTLKSHTRPIERLDSYEILDENEVPTGRIGVFSVDSMGVMKGWEVWREGVEVKMVQRTEKKDHEMGIFDLVVRGSEGEVWTGSFARLAPPKCFVSDTPPRPPTASADNSVLLSSFSPSSPSTPPTPTLRIPHPAPLKSLLLLSHSLPSLNLNILLTGASDELIRLFDIDSLSPNQGTGKGGAKWIGLPIEEKDVRGCINSLEGHAHEIVGIDSYLVYKKAEEGGGVEAWILTSSLDGTLRRWKWSEMREKQVVKGVLVLEGGEDEADGKGESLMTEEEERELEELMGDD